MGQILAPSPESRGPVWKKICVLPWNAGAFQPWIAESIDQNAFLSCGCRQVTPEQCRCLLFWAWPLVNTVALCLYRAMGTPPKERHAKGQALDLADCGPECFEPKITTRNLFNQADVGCFRQVRAIDPSLPVLRRAQASSRLPSNIMFSDAC
jgi:hypothetical protein